MFSYRDSVVGFKEYADLDEIGTNPVRCARVLRPQEDWAHFNQAGLLWIRREADEAPFLGAEVGWSCIKPRFLLLPQAGKIVFGAESTLFTVNTDSDSINKLADLESYFYGFLEIPGTSDVLVIYETGVLRTSVEGFIKWQYSAPGILTWPTFSAENIVMSADGSNLEIDVETGNRLGGRDTRQK